MKKILALSACAVLPIMASPVFAQSTTPAASGSSQSSSSGATNSGSMNSGTTTAPSAPGTSTAPGTGTAPAPMPGTPGAPSGPGATDSSSAGAGGTGASTMGARPGATPTQAVDGQSVKHSFMGKAVYNENDEKIGDVQDVVLDADGKATTFVIGAGGFLGMGQHDVAVPFDKITQTDDRLILGGFTKEQLKALPAVEVSK